MKLEEATNIYIGTSSASAVYVGSDKIWPTTPQHLIYGTCSAQSNRNIVINGETSSSVNVELNVSNGEFWLDTLPSSISTITSLKDCFVEFNGYSTNNQYLETLEVFDLPTQSCTNWRGMFYQCKNATSIKLSGITSACNNITALFMDCYALKTLDLSGCVITGITSENQYGAFNKCNSLTDVYITEQATLNQLTNNLSSRNSNYIPATATIHFNDDTIICDYKWSNNQWIQVNS